MSKTPKCYTILDSMPPEFHAHDYRSAAGVKSASGFIAHLCNQGTIERIGHGRYRKLNGAAPAPPPTADMRSAVSSLSTLFDDMAALIADCNRLREENSTLRGEVDRLREESTWLTSEINRWSEIARSAKQIRMGGGVES